MNNKIFLCVSKEENNFECKEFKNFIEADKYFNNNYPISLNIKSTMVSSCSYIPEFLTKISLGRKLEKTFNEKIKSVIII
jgi:hypothetical protein